MKEFAEAKKWRLVALLLTGGSGVGLLGLLLGVLTRMQGPARYDFVLGLGVGLIAGSIAGGIFEAERE